MIRTQSVRASRDFVSWMKMVKDCAEKDGGIKLSEVSITHLIAHSIQPKTLAGNLDEIKFQKFGAVLDLPVVFRIARKKRLI